jgi:hypothetical protein
MISPELLYRFGEPIFLTYPTREETQLLLESTGIAKLAKQVGIAVTADQIDYTQGGMRVLETLATRVELAYHARRSSDRMQMPPEQGPGDSSLRSTD